MWQSLSPLDHRYRFLNPELFDQLSQYLSEEANIRYQLKAEVALLETLVEFELAPHDLLSSLKTQDEGFIPIDEIYAEELKIEHNIRALVNMLGRRLRPEYRRFVHLFATSYDIVDTARAVQFKETTRELLLPTGKLLLSVLMDKARQTAGDLQIGRTHGRFAEPITFGFFLAGYVARLGNRLVHLKQTSENLRGKFSGAVGAHNALSLLPGIHPHEFETRFLVRLGLQPSDAHTATQIVHPEYMVDFIYAGVSLFGVLANLSDDLRNLSRSEIDEVEVKKIGSESTVGSSTMPHKINPKDFEHVKSLWKVYMPRLQTLLLDQISEHQRDLTNSASGRFLNELLAGLTFALERMESTLSALHVKKENLKRNFTSAKSEIMAEPLYILLALKGCPDPYDVSKKLIRESRQSQFKKDLVALIQEEPSLKAYLDQFDEADFDLLKNPEKYTGKSYETTLKTCEFWEQKLGTL